MEILVVPWRTMGPIYYDIAATFILIMDLYLFLFRKRLFSRDTKAFGWLLVVSLGSVLTDILGVVTYWYAQSLPLWLLNAINTLYYVFQNSIAPLFALFILSLSTRLTRMKFHRRILLLLPWLASMVIILPTFHTGLAFFFDEAHRYSRGPALPFLYFLVLLYTFMGSIILRMDRAYFPRNTHLAICLFLPFSLIPVILQYFFPEILVQNLGVAVSELFILLTVQDFGRYTDRTSGLYNRSGFVAQLEILMRKRKRIVIFLISLDVVGFLKEVLGPGTFEELQGEIIRKFSGSTSLDRFASQLGEGRYALVLGEQTNPEAERDALLECFRNPWIVQDRSLSVSAHLCEIRIPEDTENIQSVFQAEYKLSNTNWRNAKKTVLSMSDLSLGDTKRKYDIGQLMRKALVSTGFDVYYQPIVSLETGRVVSAEVLLRLYDDEMGWIPPEEFIAIAEQNGSIHRLGDFVFDAACAFLAELRATGNDLGYFEINLSIAQCIQSNINERLLSISRRYNLRPEDICLEITETAANFTPSITKKNLEGLSSLGFPIAMDDFGTGYSNIGNFMEIPFQMVKLDRSLIMGMERSRNGLVGLEMLVEMFKNMGTQIVAEGIETESQLETVRKLGIDLIQGFYFARPMPADKFKAFLLERTSPCI